MNEHTTSVQPLRPLIPAWLDDLGLKPVPHRILMHLWRRAGHDLTCYPGRTSIAAICGIQKVDTVGKYLKELERKGLIERHRRDGTSNIYRLVLPPTPPRGSPHETGQPAKQGHTHHVQQEARHPTKRSTGSPHETGHKGYPVKGIPVKAIQPNTFKEERVVGQDRKKSWLAIQRALPRLSGSWAGYINRWKLMGTPQKAQLSALIHEALIAGMPPSEIERALSDYSTDQNHVIDCCSTFLGRPRST